MFRNNLYNQTLKIFLFIFITSFFKGYPLLASCTKEDCNISHLNLINQNNNKNLLSKNYFVKKNTFTRKLISNREIEDVLESDNFELDSLFLKIVQIDNQSEFLDKQPLNLEIESDTQYLLNDIFYAEGSVKVYLPNGVLSAEKISYNKTKKLFNAEGKISFVKGNQYVESDYLEYDLLNETGFLLNAYGILDFLKLDNDLNIEKLKSEPITKNRDEILYLPSEVELLSTSNLRFKRKKSESIGFNLNFESVTTWRFKADRIDINSDSWSSKKIYFTNDVFNRPQFIIESKNFYGEIKNKKYRLRSGRTFLIFDDKARIPVGRRNIRQSGVKPRWGIGYDYEEKDGFYIIRSFDNIKLSKNLSLQLQPYFLLQRSLKGESNAFRENGSSFLDSEVKQKTNFYDSFSLNTTLTGNISEWDLELNTDLKSLNLNRFNESISGDLNLIKNIYESNSKRFSSDVAIYSIFSKDEIYTSLGVKSINSYKNNYEGLEKNYSLIFDGGTFRAINLSKDKLVSLGKLGTSLSFKHKYELISFGDGLRKYDSSYKNIPSLTNQGIFFNAGIAYGLSYYDDNYSQSVASVNLGPSLVFGELKRKLLDYTTISLTTDYVLFKNGESPFAFDNYNSDSRLNLDFRQQIFGPLIMGFSANINIDNNSSDYGKLKNKVYTLGISRRAYSLEAFYDSEEEAAGARFAIFNFGFNNKVKKFK